MSTTTEISIKWNAEDVRGVAEQLGISLTNDQIGDILDDIGRRHDAEIGINWDVIEAFITTFITSQDLKKIIS